jgi:hypothetical protein
MYLRGSVEAQNYSKIPKQLELQVRGKLKAGIPSKAIGNDFWEKELLPAETRVELFPIELVAFDIFHQIA